MTPTTDLQKLLAEVPPDYGYVQAVLTANLIRRGVIDQIIPREEMPEWAKVLADVACKPLAARVIELEAENVRLREELKATQGRVMNVQFGLQTNTTKASAANDLGVIANKIAAALKRGEI